MVEIVIEWMIRSNRDHVAYAACLVTPSNSVETAPVQTEDMVGAVLGGIQIEAIRGKLRNTFVAASQVFQESLVEPFTIETIELVDGNLSWVEETHRKDVGCAQGLVHMDFVPSAVHNQMVTELIEHHGQGIERRFVLEL